MNIYNQHQNQLINRITQKIQNIDRSCTNITNEIHLYSDSRLKNLQQRATQAKHQIVQLTKEKTRNQHSQKDLLQRLQFLKKDCNDLQKERKAKQQQNKVLERQIMFVNQKNRQEKPFLEGYLKEKAKHEQASLNLHYAKCKLKQLENKYAKQSQEVQYQYKMVVKLRHKLATMKAERINKISKQTNDISVYENPIKGWAQFPTKTEESQDQEYPEQHQK